MRIIAQRCIPLRSGASEAEDLRIDSSRAPRDSGLSRNFRGYESATTWITLSSMDQYLCRRRMPRPKFGRSRPTTTAAAPATFHMVHLQVVRRKQMAIATDVGYGHGLKDTGRRKAYDMSFGCIKARPRYQFSISLILLSILL